MGVSAQHVLIFLGIASSTVAGLSNANGLSRQRSNTLSRSNGFVDDDQVTSFRFVAVGDWSPLPRSEAVKFVSGPYHQLLQREKFVSVAISTGERGQYRIFNGGEDTSASHVTTDSELVTFPKLTPNAKELKNVYSFDTKEYSTLNLFSPSQNGHLAYGPKQLAQLQNNHDTLTDTWSKLLSNNPFTCPNTQMSSEVRTRFFEAIGHLTQKKPLLSAQQIPWFSVLGHHDTEVEALRKVAASYPPVLPQKEQQALRSSAYIETLKETKNKDIIEQLLAFNAKHFTKEEFRNVAAALREDNGKGHNYLCPDSSFRHEKWNLPQFYYSRLFKIPLVGEDDSKVSDMTVFIAFIDTTILATPNHPGYALHWAWIKDVLGSQGAKSATWKFVVGHHPIFSVGEEGSTALLVNHLKPLLERFQVSAYIHGHDDVNQVFSRSSLGVPSRMMHIGVGVSSSSKDILLAKQEAANAAVVSKSTEEKGENPMAANAEESAQNPGASTSYNAQEDVEEELDSDDDDDDDDSLDGAEISDLPELSWSLGQTRASFAVIDVVSPTLAKVRYFVIGDENTSGKLPSKPAFEIRIPNRSLPVEYQRKKMMKSQRIKETDDTMQSLLDSPENALHNPKRSHLRRD